MDRTLDQTIELICSTGFQDLPVEVVEQGRNVFVDSLGCALGARDCVGVRTAFAYPGMPTEAGLGTVIGYRDRLCQDVAAFANTSMIRSLDFNDTLGIGHPSDMLGALVAVVDSTDVSGKDMLTSIAVAYEVFSRIDRQIRRMTEEDGFRVDPLTLDYGYAVSLGAVAGLCKLLRMSEEETRHAVAFAATSALSLRASRAGELSDYKGVATAFSAKDAVFCAHMARCGMTAPSDPFEGRHGLAELLRGSASPLTLPTDGWGINRSFLKYFPVTANNQIAAWAALELRKRLEGKELAHVRLRTSRFLHHESASEPAKWKPTTKETADHSLPYVFSRCLTDGYIDHTSFAPMKLQESSIRALIEKLVVEVDDDIESEWPEVLQIRVDAVDTEGNDYSVSMRDPRGTRENPMGKDDIAEKFQALTTSALGTKGSELAFESAWTLETAASVADILARLVPDEV